MPVPDRLADLRRQRALIQEHLAWMDREIASAEGAAFTPASPAPIVPSPAVATPPSLPLVDPNADQAAEAILNEYRASNDVQRDVRKGCFLYFVGAFIALAALVAILWFALRR